MDCVFQCTNNYRVITLPQTLSSLYAEKKKSILNWTQSFLWAEQTGGTATILLLLSASQPHATGS